MSETPILLELPEAFETSRLIIRAPRYGDGVHVQAAIEESIEELRPWMPWAQEVPTVDQSEENVRRARLQFFERSDLRMHLFDKATGQLVGSSGLHRNDWTVRKFEIGYWVRTSMAGRGYITEAVDGITQFAVNHLQANRIEIRCDAKNVRSARVAARSGFTREALFRSDSVSTTGQLRDTLVFSKVRGYEF